MSEDLRDLERQIRSWTARPPARSPRVARTRVLARIEARRRWAPWKLAAAAAVAVALAAGLIVRGPGAPPGPPVVADEPSPGLLVYQLESGTQLYFALAPSTVLAPTPLDNPTLEGNGS